MVKTFNLSFLTLYLRPINPFSESHFLCEVYCFPVNRLKILACYTCKSYFLEGGWITWNIVSDVYILTKGKKGINAEN